MFAAVGREPRHIVLASKPLPTGATLARCVRAGCGHAPSQTPPNRRSGRGAVNAEPQVSQGPASTALAPARWQWPSPQGCSALDDRAAVGVGKGDVSYWAAKQLLLVVEGARGVGAPSVLGDRVEKGTTQRVELTSAGLGLLPLLPDRSYFSLPSTTPSNR